MKGLLRVSLAAAVLAAGVAAQAQTAHFAGAVTVLGSGFNLPSGVAVDASGNVYVADSANGAVKKIPYSGGSYGTPVTLDSGFSHLADVAVDASGNVYVTDQSNSAVTEIPYSGGIYGTPVTLGSGFNGPYGVAVDASGNVYVANSFDGTVKEVPYSGGIYGTPVTLGSGFSYPTGVAVDASGNVYVGDTFNNAVKEIPYSGGIYGTPVPLGSGFNRPYGVVVDASGNVYVGDSSNNAVKEIPYSSGSYGVPVTLGGGFSNPQGVAVDASGNVYVAADTTNNPVKKISFAPNFGAAAVATSTPVTENLYFGIDSAGTLPALSNANVLTQGASGLDFTLGTGSTCTGAVTVGNSCTVVVSFTPQYPGQRLGAVNLRNSSGTTLAMAFLSGLGTGPEALFTNGTFGVVKALGANSQNAITIDASGNIYYSVYNAGTVNKLAAGGGAITQLASGLSGPSGVAVDGAGNVFYADYGASKIYELAGGTGTGVQILTAASPNGLAIDGAGNLYAALAGSTNVVQKYTAGTFAASTAYGTGLSNPQGIALDSLDNLFVASAADGRVLSINLATGAQTIVAMGLSTPVGIAVDAAGDSYVALKGNHTIQRFASGTYAVTTLATNLSAIAYLALDGAGDLYVADTTNSQIVEFTRTSASLGFPNTAAGSNSSAQNLTLENDGSASLTVGSIQPSNANFGFAGGVSSGSSPGCGGPLAPGAQCNVQAKFTPQSIGAITGNGIVTDNSLNVSNATQTDALSGTGTDPFTVTGVSPSYGPAAGGTTVTITGTGLSNVTQVTFGGVAATSFTLGSGTQMTAVAPAGTGTVDIIVGSATYVSVATTADQFSYVPTYTVTVNTDTTNGVAANCYAGSTNCSLRDAIAATNAAGFTGTTGAQPTINFAPGLSGQTITLNSPALNPTANVNIAGPGAALLTIAPTTSYTYSAFTSTTNSLAFTLSGVTVTGFGFPSSGASPALLFSPNSQSLATGDLITLNNDTFSNNGGTPGGTTASNTGGALNVTSSTLAVAGSIFTGNSANSGGAIYAGYANVAITGSTFGTQATPNRALTGVGGALFLISSLANSATIGTSTFAYNISKANGASVYATAPLTLNTDVFLNNAASSNGGAVYTTGALTVAGSTFNNNTAASNGGAIFATGLLIVSGSSFMANQAGTTSVTSGGAIYSSSTGANSISNTNFLANRVVTTGGTANGGALYASVANLINVLFSGNSTSGGTNSFGGAAYYYGSANSQLTGVTFTGNSTQTGSTGATNQEGGALYLGGSAVMRLYNSTISGNSAKLGGGVYNSGDGVTNFYNSVTSGNSGSTGHPDFDNANGGGYYTDGNDYVDVAATCSTSCTPLLSALGNYGGGTVGAPGYTTPVQVMLPLPGSPLLAAGSLSYVGTPGTMSGGATTDARGYPRTTSYNGSPHVDIGAAEANYSLSFVQQPTDTAVGATVSPAPTVQLLESGVAGGDGVGNDQGSYAGGTLAISATPDAASAATVATTASGLESLSESFTPAANGETLTVAAQSGAATPVTVASTTSNAFNVFSLTPVVSSISPASGVPAGGTAVTITGTNFTSAATVSFGGAAATNVAYNSTTSITATSPAGIGAVDVTVTTSGGTSATSAGDRFTYIPASYVFVANSTGSVSSYGSTGGAVTTSVSGGGIGVAVDNSGNVWSITAGGTGVTQFAPAGTATATYTPAGISGASAIAVDGAGSVWVVQGGSSSNVFELTNAGAAVSPTGYAQAGGISTPTSVSVDTAGSLWIANSGNNTVTEIIGVAAPVATPTLTQVVNATPGARP